jgi:Calcineurin-like phosphoesterase
MATLVLSDLHLGLRSGRDLLRRAEVRARLWEQLGGINRVVLLGDTVELRQGSLSAALAAARPFFEELGAVLGGGEVVLVPGNHDHRLLACWHERRRTWPGARLGLEQRIEPGADDPAGAAAAWLGPVSLTLAYPGLWLRPDVYATHGHYLDRHVTLPTLERLAVGALGRLVGPLPEHPGPGDYEAALAPLYAWIHEVAQSGAGRRASGGASGSRLWRLLGPGRGDRPPRVRSLGPVLPLATAVLNRLGLGPLRADVAVADLAPAGLRAMGEVCKRLGLDARFVLFGHLHRAGPVPGDDAGLWRAPTGTLLVNTGSWVEDLSLVGADASYRPGTCIRVEATGAPELVRVLGGASVADNGGAPRAFSGWQRVEA